MHQSVGLDVPTAVRMASLTPAAILGRADDLGSLEVGKIADLLILDTELSVRTVFIAGEQVAIGRPADRLPASR
jgi:N-acetylglucosamine-6-phosphate deacetylase